MRHHSTTAGQRFSPNGYGLVENRALQINNGDMSPNIENHNEIGSYQSHSSSKMLRSELYQNDMKQGDSVEKLKWLPHSLTNPEKFGT